MVYQSGHQTHFRHCLELQGSYIPKLLAEVTVHPTESDLSQSTSNLAIADKHTLLLTKGILLEYIPGPTFTQMADIKHFKCGYMEKYIRNALH